MANISLNMSYASKGDRLLSDLSWAISGIVDAAKGVYAWKSDVRPKPETNDGVAFVGRPGGKKGNRYTHDARYQVADIVNDASGLYAWRNYVGSFSKYLRVAQASSRGGPVYPPQFHRIATNDYNPQVILRHTYDVDRSTMGDRALQLRLPSGELVDMFLAEVPSNTYDAQVYPDYSRALRYKAGDTYAPPALGNWDIITTTNPDNAARLKDGSPLLGGKVISYFQVVPAPPAEVEVRSPNGWETYAGSGEIDFTVSGTAPDETYTLSMTEGGVAWKEDTGYPVTPETDIDLTLVGVISVSGDVEFGSRIAYNGHYYWDSLYSLGKEFKTTVQVGDNKVEGITAEAGNESSLSNPTIYMPYGGTVVFKTVRKE